MLHNGDSFEKIRRILWDLTNKKVWQCGNIMHILYVFCRFSYPSKRQLDLPPPLEACALKFEQESI